MQLELFERQGLVDPEDLRDGDIIYLHGEKVAPRTVRKKLGEQDRFELEGPDAEGIAVVYIRHDKKIWMNEGTFMSFRSYGYTYQPEEVKNV